MPLHILHFLLQWNWNLRLASIKLMAPVFSAFDRPTYRKLLPQHLADCLQLPSEIQEQFTQGRFVVSITGRSWYSVGLDESLEMLINKDCKSAVIHPNKEFISRKALYFPFRSKSISNFKNQVKPKNQENVHNLDLKTEMKSKENVHAMIIALDKSNALPSNPMGCVTLRYGLQI